MVFNFNLKNSIIYPSVKWDFIYKNFKLFKKVFFILFLVCFLVLIFYGFLLENLSNRGLKFFFGLLIIFFVLFLGSWIKQSFFNLKLKNPEIEIKLSKVIDNPDNYNLANFLSFEIAQAINKSIISAKSSETTSTHIFYFLLKDNQKLNFVFNRSLLDLNQVKKTLKGSLKNLNFLSKKRKNLNSSIYSNDFKETILESFKIAQKKNHLRIEIGDILTALSIYEPVFRRILIDFELKIEDIENLTWWLEDIEEKIKKRKRFWDYDNLAKKGTLAKGWSSGYTITLDKYSFDWTSYLRKNPPAEIGHKKEIELVERVLASHRINNVLMIGESGTGRKSIIQALVNKSLLGESLEGVNYKRIVELNMAGLLAGIENAEQVEVILDKIFKEVVSAGNIILVINDFHNYIGQENRLGIVDISGIISPYLQMSEFKIIAITTYNGLHQYIEKNSSLLSLFEKVEISQLSERETLMVLENLTFFLEKKHKRFISYPALRQTVSLTKRYMDSSPLLGKAIEILDEAIIYTANSTQDKIVLPKHIAKVITEKTEIPVGDIKQKEKEKLLDLEELIHQRIINQNEAVNEISSAMRRARSEITIRKGPLGAFIFLGPTGVGKTETSKALAEVYFGSEDKMIRLDMSEFQDIKDISRLIGTPDQPGFLTTPVRENPFSLILLDEIEKAHPNILNLFLQVLDEGHLTDGSGRKVSFKNTIIISTSNAGYKVILESLKNKVDWQGVKQKLLDYLFKNNMFRPEFINRFDGVVVFSPLSKENLLDISQLMLNKLKKNLKEKGVEFIITEPLKQKIVELGYDPVFGARAMRRVIQDKVENILASAFLSGKLKRGSKVKVSEIFELIINF
ncbi:MAG: ATP-dependent Clp protease ATP-binding subunit [Candidatus Nealsonbacteria bacterium]